MHNLRAEMIAKKVSRISSLVLLTALSCVYVKKKAIFLGHLEAKNNPNISTRAYIQQQALFFFPTIGTYLIT